MVTMCLMKNVADNAPSVSSFPVINYFFTRKKFRENLFNYMEFCLDLELFNREFPSIVLKLM